MREGGDLMPRCSRWLIALAFLMLPALAAAQNATVQGTVVDESKASMPGATITVTELASGRQSVAVTEVDGRYRFDNLAPGTYKLRVELPGFATVEIPSL